MRRRRACSTIICSRGEYAYAGLGHAGIAAATARVQAHDEQIAALGQAHRLLLGRRAHDERRDTGARLGQGRRRLERAGVGAGHLGPAVGVDEVCEREAQAEVSGQRGGLVAGAQQPHLGYGGPGRHGEYAAERMLGRQVAVQEAQHVRHLLHEVVDADLTARRQGAGG
jgi:hypothetical protein